MNRIGIILQARMSSVRFPGKVMKALGSKTLLEHIVDRMQYLKGNYKFIVATSDNKKDDAVVEYCINKGVLWFRGSERDVLERYYRCSCEHKFDHVVRLTGDNPFVDVDELSNLINYHLDGKYDYSQSFDCLPVGVGAEVFTFKALERSYKEGLQPNHREHVNEFIHENSQLFHCGTLEVRGCKSRPDIRLTVDTEDDYAVASFIVSNTNSEYIGTEEAIEYYLQYNSSNRE